jgi:hypothetical protein
LRAFAGHASGAGSADAARRASYERMNTVQPISHLTNASYQARDPKKRIGQPSFDGGRIIIEFIVPSPADP